MILKFTIFEITNNSKQYLIMEQLDDEIFYSLGISFVLLLLLCIYAIMNCTGEKIYPTPIIVNRVTVIPNRGINSPEKVWGDL